MKFKIGDQVAYMPAHANGDINHKDVEFGFVTSVNYDTNAIFCRYWSNYNSAILRTQANSEGCSPDQLIHHIFKPQREIDRMLVQLGYVEVLD